MGISTGLLISLAGLGFFTYMTGQTGIIILSVLLVAIMILIYLKQNILLYMPVIPGLPKSPSQNTYKMRHPNEHNLHSSDLELTTSDGIVVRGWHVKMQNSQRVLIYFHQNAGSKFYFKSDIGTRLYYVREICKRTNSDVILVAYRGFSDSDSVPSQNGLMEDSYAIMEYAFSYSQKNYNKPIYALGRSLGGAVTINLASQNKYAKVFRGIILENTFTSIGEMVDCLFPVLVPFKFLQRNFWPSIDRIKKITCPILFIKSMQDELVPPIHMHRLMEAATCRKKQYRIDDGTHNSSWDLEPDTYFRNLSDFFTENEN